MRIRKRKVPLPLSLLSPIPLSDPHLFSRSPVMLVQEATTTFHSQPSDLLTLTSSSDLHRRILGYHETGVDGVIQKSDDDYSNKASITSTRDGATLTDDNTDNNKGSNNAGRWSDGDNKEIPFKKRRTNFNRSVEDTITATPNEDGNEKSSIRANNNGNTTGEVVVPKKGNTKRGNTIMEGSRCSRVNGRGWRCCQPTLVGYSLCEHHLGKGRLRSITNGSSGSGSNSSIVKARMAKKKNNSSNGTSFALGRRDEPQREVYYDNDNDEKKLETKMMSSFGNNKRVKLGVVKARSLSSLLGQTNTLSFGEDNATMEMEKQHDKLIINLDHQ